MTDRSLFQSISIPAVEDRLRFFLHSVGKRLAASKKLTPEVCAQHIIDILKNPSLNDIDILTQLATYITMDHPPKKKSTYRQTSRVADIEPELDKVKAVHWNPHQRRLKPSFTYLDIGCSEGKITEAVAEALNLSPSQAYACDIMDNKHNERHLYTFQKNTITTLPYQDNAFELMTMFMSAHHFSDVHAMFDEAKRVGRPGAYLIMREHCDSDPANLPMNSAYYNIFHAIYACTTLVKTPAENTPDSFMEEYHRPGGYATYRSVADWSTIALLHGFVQESESHGPLAWNQPSKNIYEKDRLFDATYLWFRLSK